MSAEVCPSQKKNPKKKKPKKKTKKKKKPKNKPHKKRKLCWGGLDGGPPEQKRGRKLKGEKGGSKPGRLPINIRSVRYRDLAPKGGAEEKRPVRCPSGTVGLIGEVKGEINLGGGEKKVNPGQQVARKKRPRDISTLPSQGKGVSVLRRLSKRPEEREENTEKADGAEPDPWGSWCLRMRRKDLRPLREKKLWGQKDG